MVTTREGVSAGDNAVRPELEARKARALSRITRDVSLTKTIEQYHDLYRSLVSGTEDAEEQNVGLHPRVALQPACETSLSNADSFDSSAGAAWSSFGSHSMHPALIRTSTSSSS
jgi:hypothetical protein